MLLRKGVLPHITWKSDPAHAHYAKNGLHLGKSFPPHQQVTRSRFSVVLKDGEKQWTNGRHPEHWTWALDYPLKTLMAYLPEGAWEWDASLAVSLTPKVIPAQGWVMQIFQVCWKWRRGPGVALTHCLHWLGGMVVPSILVTRTLAPSLEWLSFN